MQVLVTVPLGKEQEIRNQTPVPVTVPLPEVTREPTWAGVLNGNRSATNGMALHYITPDLVEGNLVTKLEKSNLDSETMKWKCALIIYVIGDTPMYKFMEK